MNLLRAFVLSATVLLCMTAALAGSLDPPAGASACSGCHPPSSSAETGVPTLAGRDAQEIVTQMRAFRSGQREATVMGRIAKGYSDAEIEAIAAWYQRQR
jgi:sulfide dehydrogenase cytochrome subunit